MLPYGPTVSLGAIFRPFNGSHLCSRNYHLTKVREQMEPDDSWRPHTVLVLHTPAIMSFDWRCVFGELLFGIYQPLQPRPLGTPYNIPIPPGIGSNRLYKPMW